MSNRRRFEHSDIGQAVLVGRPFPDRPGGTMARFDLSWQEDAIRCREADETTSYVMVEAEYQDDIGKDDLRSLCGYCPVAYECLTAGIRMHASGVWGGVVIADGRVAPMKRKAA